MKNIGEQREKDSRLSTWMKSVIDKCFGDGEVAETGLDDSEDATSEFAEGSEFSKLEFPIHRVSVQAFEYFYEILGSATVPQILEFMVKLNESSEWNTKVMPDTPSEILKHIDAYPESKRMFVTLVGQCVSEYLNAASNELREALNIPEYPSMCWGSHQDLDTLCIRKDCAYRQSWANYSQLFDLEMSRWAKESKLGLK